jgi:hypothetical protein
MRLKGKHLEFISLIKRDGSGVIPIPTQWTNKSGHAKTDDMSYCDEDEFDLICLSATEKTYIASEVNSFVVKIKSDL